MVTVQKQKGFPVLGIDISPYTKEEFFKLLEQRLIDDDPNSPPYFVITVNPEIAVQSIIDNEFKQILTSSSINTADGIGISWAVNVLYGKQVDRITGSDSMEQICRLCTEHTQPVFLYGAMPGVADEAAEVLQDRIDNLEIAGTFSPDRPDFDLEDLPVKTQQQLQEASCIFVALGAPAQEKWISKNLRKLPNCKLIIGIGGSFDFIAGKIKRAPKWMRKSGLEWVYRLYLQPSRWRRMLKYPVFVVNILFLKYTTK